MLTNTIRLAGAAILGIGLLLPVTILADGGDGGSSNNNNSWTNARLKPVHDVIALEDYDTAITKLEVLLEEDPQSPDVLNLLGFSHRQQGRFDVAHEYYVAALELKPTHKGANEYLGELYLQTGQLAKAEERLEVLDKACFFGCKEYTMLKKAVAQYKDKNGLASQ